MKISFLMGRGIEGCGVTKFTLEQNDWFNRNGHTSTIFAPKDKNWTRKTSHEVAGVVCTKWAKDEEADKVIAACNESDFIIITSLPSVGHPEGCISNFKKILASLDKPVVFIQLDHKMMSIKRNAALDEAIDASDVMFSLSRYNDFCKYVKQRQGGAFGALEGIKQTQIFAYQVGFRFDENKAIFWKDIKEQDVKHHKWIGRTTSWKGYDQMFKFHNNFLRGNGCLTTFEGIEKSPAFLGFKDLSEFIECVGQDPETYDLSNGYGNLAHVFGPYNNEQLLHRLSKCGFGYQLSLLDQPYIENALEYTHCEIVATGVIPVFRAGWGRRAKHRVTQVPLIDCKDTGTIWLDDDDMAPALEQIKMLEKDEGMREEWRNMAFEFYREHQDAEHIFVDMWNKMKSYVGA